MLSESAETRRITPLAALYVLILWNRGMPTRARFWSNCCRNALLLSRPAMAALRTPSLGPIRGALDLPPAAQCVSEWVRRHRASLGGLYFISIGNQRAQRAMDRNVRNP